jgi:hypothetical protein
VFEMSSDEKPCGCQAILDETDTRAPIWKEVFGKLEFPLEHPIPFKMETFPGQLFFAGDSKALSPEEKERFISAMMKKFNVSREHVETSWDVFGCIPILYEHITLKICELHLRCMM